METSHETYLTSANNSTGANCTSANNSTGAKHIQPVQTGARQAKFYSEEQLLTYAKGAKVQNDPCKDKNCTPAPVQKPMTPVQKETKNLAKDLNDILQEKGNAGVAAEMKKMLADFDEEKEKAAVDAAQAEKEAAEKAAAEKELMQEFISKPLEDQDNADRLNLMCGDEIRWDLDSQNWLLYENGVWKPRGNSNSVILPYTRRVSDFIENKYQQAKNLVAVSIGEKLNKKWKKRKTQFNAIELLKGIDRILITQADLDKNPMLLNVKNGVVDLESGKLYPAAPELLLTKQCNAAFNPAAPAPLFEEFMKQILPEEETRAAMLRYLGYCLTGLTVEEKVFFAYGKGGNGKGTLLGTIQHLLGDYATSFKIGVLLKQKYGVNPDAASPEIAKLKGVRFAVVSESKDVKQFDTAVLKDLTGGDMTTARAMYQQPITFKPSHKFALQGNNLPAPENISDEGFLRRFYIIKFLESFIGSAANLNLKAELVTADSLNGILALLVRACLAWQREGLIISAAMQAAKKEYIEENDFVAEFISDNCEFVSNAYIPRKEFLNRLKEDKKFSRAQYKDKQLVEMITAIEGITEKPIRDKGKVAFFGVKWLDSSAQGDF